MLLALEDIRFVGLQLFPTIPCNLVNKGLTD